MWKSKIKKFAGRALTVFILIQLCICIALAISTASGKEASVFGYSFYYIVSPSMEPTISVGSQIIVKEFDTDKLVEDDIITFQSNDPSIQGLPNTHRIVDIVTDEQGNKAFITKGDNNPSADAYLVYPSEVYGKVVAIAPGWDAVITFYTFAATPIGFAVVIIMPILLVLSAFLRSFTKELKRLNEQNVEEGTENNDATGTE